MISEDSNWITDFFGQGNGWDLGRIRNSGYSGILQSKLEKMLQPCLIDKPPFVLPRVDEKRQLSFYIIGESGRQLHEINRVIHAYLGNVNSYMDPRIFKEPGDKIEESLLQAYPHGFSRIFVPTVVSQDKPQAYAIFDVLNAAIEQFGKKPHGIAVSQRNVGRVLRDFFTACSREDGGAAREFFNEIKATRAISGRNLVSLDLQCLAAQSKWSNILEHPRLPDIVAGRASRRIIQIVLRAIHQNVIDPNEYSASSPEDVRRALHRSATVFLRHPDLDEDDPVQLWKTWCIGVAIFGNASTLGPTLRERVGDGWLDSMLEWAGLKASLPDRSEPPIADRLSSKPSIKAAVGLLQSALVLNSEDCKKIYETLARYPDQILAEVTAHSTLRSVWASLETEFAPTQDVNSWSDWLASLIGGTKQSQSVDAIAELCAYWASETWDEENVTNSFFALADSDRVSDVRNILPLLLEWTRERHIAISASFINAISVILSSDDAFSIQDLGLFAELLELQLQVAHTTSEYEDLVHAALKCWERVQSVSALDSAIEIMDALLDGVCASSQKRLEYWNSLQSFCISSWKRLSVRQQLLIRNCAEDATKSASQFPSVQESDTDEALSSVNLAGKRLAIYTLTEGAARRASSVIHKLFPGIEIRLNHDKTATDALVNLAKTADYFVFASRSATHQAFYPVTKVRAEILYPNGKGSSSIVRCVLDAFANH